MVKRRRGMEEEIKEEDGKDEEEDGEDEEEDGEYKD